MPYQSFFGTPTVDYAPSKGTDKQIQQQRNNQVLAKKKKKDEEDAKKAQQNSILNRVASGVKSIASVGKSVGNAAIAGERTAATGVARILPGGTADIQAQQKQAESAAKNIKQVKDQVKAGTFKPEAAKKLIKSNADSAGGASSAQAKTLKAMPTKGQVALGFASTAADIVSAGTIGAAAKGAKAGKVLKGADQVKNVQNAEKASSLLSKGQRVKEATKAKTGIVAANASAGGLNAGAAGGDKKNVITNTLAGAALPEVLRFGGHAVADTAEKVAGKVSTKPAKELINKTNTQSLLHADTGKALDDIMGKIKASPKEMQEIKNRSLLRQTAEKNQVAASKIDQKIELVEAKKADGKFTNVDAVKVKQLKAEKEQLVPAKTDASSATAPTTPVSNSAVPPSTVSKPEAVAGKASSKESIDPLAELKQEALKHKSATDFIKAQRTKAGDYVGSHQAPTRGDGYNAPGHNVTGGAGIFPEDIYTDPKAYHYYGHGGSESQKAMDKQSIELIRQMKGNPDKEITIYRSVPKSKNVNDIAPGDWITHNKDYAISHAKSQFGNDYKILEKRVKADEIFTDGNSPHEFGYDPRPTHSDKELTDLYHQAHAQPTQVAKTETKIKTGETNATIPKVQEQTSATPNGKTLEPSTRTLKPSETAHMPEIAGYTHSEHLANDYAAMLRGQELQAKGGQMIKQANGSYIRTSEHSRFYRDFYKETGRPPTKADYLEQAKKELENNKDGIGAGEDYKKLLEREAKPVPRVQVESTVKNVPQGTSRVGDTVLENAVGKSLKNKYGEAAQYDRITIADQAKKAVALTEDKAQLERVISGEAPLPDGLRATALIDAIERHPVLGKDTDLLLKVAKSPLASESSYSAQELRLAAERVENSPIEAMKTIRLAREKAAEQKLGKPVKEAVTSEIKQIRATTPTVKKEDWSSFIDSLKC